MLRYGIISDTDPVNGLARVKFTEDNVVSDWLPVSVQYKGQSFPLETNDQVWVAMESNAENGIIGGFTYNQSVQPDGGAAGKYRSVLSDGAIFEYDANSNTSTYTNGDVSFVVSRSGGFTIKKGGESVKKLFSDLLDKINEITVTTYTGPSGTPINAVDFEAIKTRLDDIFVE